jgi:hypothetical protein
MFVGGEFYYDDSWLLDKPVLSTEGMYFLNGGIACLTIIGDYLLDHGISRVLLPSYLCPSIVTTFNRHGLACDFYQVNQDFSIDLDELSQKIESFKALLFINTFGFIHPPAVRSFLKDLSQNGVSVIEDNAQAWFHDHPTGDFILNSARKFCPYDGGYLITRHDLNPYLESYPVAINRRLPIIREYRRSLPGYLFEGLDEYDRLNDLFNLAEHYYETDVVVHGNVYERRHIERLDWPRIKQVRRDNYRYMLELIRSIPEISPILPALQDDNMPLGLPVYFSGALRDRVYDELGNAEIGLAIHWDEIKENPLTRNNPLAVDMASRILTLAIDQRTTRPQMDYLAENLIRSIEIAKNQA